MERFASTASSPSTATKPGHHQQQHHHPPHSHHPGLHHQQQQQQQQQQQHQHHHPHPHHLQPGNGVGGRHPSRSSSSMDSTSSSVIYRKSYPCSEANVSFSSASMAGSIQDDGSASDQCSLTQAELEEYSRSYFGQQVFHHQKQSSYAQSEGYHSYVSSSDSSSATPFLDRLRLDSEMLSRASSHWSQSSADLHTSSSSACSSSASNLNVAVAATAAATSAVVATATTAAAAAATIADAAPSGGGGGSVTAPNVPLSDLSPSSLSKTTMPQQPATTGGSSSGSSPAAAAATAAEAAQSAAAAAAAAEAAAAAAVSADNNSLDSTSSSETLKWLGSTSDLSVSSHATNSSAVSGTVSAAQLIAHSSRVRTPMRHHSESVLYMAEDQHNLADLSTTGPPDHSAYSAAREASETRNNSRLYAANSFPDGQPAANSELTHSSVKTSPKPNTWQSVADRISELERQQQNTATDQPTSTTTNHQQSTSPSTPLTGPSGQQQQHHHQQQQRHYIASHPVPAASHNGSGLQKFTFLDPSKTTRISNPALKAFQKNAVQSYFERQQLSQPREPIGATRQSLSAARPQSLPVHSTSSSAAQKPSPHHHSNTRSSLPSNYTTQQQQSASPSASLYPIPAAASIGSPSPMDDSPNRSPARSAHSSPVRPKASAAHEPPHYSMQQVSPATQALHSPTYQAAFQQATATFNGNNSSSSSSSHNGNGGSPTMATTMSAISSTTAYAAAMGTPDPQLAPVGAVADYRSAQAVCDDFMNESGVPPPPPRRNRSLMPVRRTSSASEYSNYRKQGVSRDLLEPMVIGPIISLDEWVPERPPKNPALRIPSPELPPPPPAMAVAAQLTGDCGQSAPDTFDMDEPLPPPPPEVLSRHVRQLSEPDQKQPTPSRRNSFAGQSTTAPPKPLYPRAAAGHQFERLSPPSAASSNGSPNNNSPPPVVPKKTTSHSLHSANRQMPSQMRPYPMSVYPHHQQRMQQQHQQHQQPAQSQTHRAIAISKQPLNGVSTTLVLHKTPQQSGHSAVKIDDLAARQLEGSRLTMRKRSHQAQLTPVEMPAVNAKLMMPPSPPNHHQQQQQQHQQQQSPPPLMPRIPLMATATAEAIARSASAMGNRLRSNSKASYLPRQSREKLNVDPDRGIYKLTLTSNEDFVQPGHHHHHNGYHHQSQQQQLQQQQHQQQQLQHPHQHYHHQQQHTNNNHHNSTTSLKSEILSAKCNNLPDVLPLGAKVHNTNSQQQHNNVHLQHQHHAHAHQRVYGSNNDINMNHQPPPPYHAYNPHPSATAMAAAAGAPHLRTPPQTAPAHNNYSVKSMFNFSRHSSSATPTSGTPTVTASPLAYSQRGNIGASTDSILAKLVSTVSVSSIDLQSSPDAYTAEHLAQLREHDSSYHHHHRQSSPPTMTPQRNASSYVARKLSLDHASAPSGTGSSEAPPLPATPVASPQPKDVDKVARKNSLKENIDKITQLQSKLMSAHIHEHDKLQRDSLSVSAIARSLLADTVRRPSPVQRGDSVELLSIAATPVDSSGAASVRQSPDLTACAAPSSPVQNQRTSYSETASQTDESALCAAAALAASHTLNGGCANLTDASTATSLSDLSAASDEDDTSGASGQSSDSPSSASLELDCQKLSAELVRQLAPSDRLHLILAPKAHRSSAFYVTGLYNPYVMPRAMRRDVGTSTPSESPVQSQSNTPVHSNSHTTATESTQPAYYAIVEPDIPPPVPTTPPPTMAHFHREVTHLITEPCTIIAMPAQSGELPPDCSDRESPVFDLTRQKEELVARLTSKIAVLINEQHFIAEEVAANDQLGVEVARKVTEKIRSVDVSKFRSYVDDVGHITMLLLSLSGRLARTENELQIVEVGDSERKTLEIKRDRLVEQLDEAKRLKEDIDRRGSVVCRCLEQHLSMDAYADYDYFINTKAKLIVDGREVLDKIKLGEDQLVALKETLVHSEC